MATSNKTARIVGALFLTSNVVFILGAVVFLEPILSAPDYLNLVSANRANVVLGVLLELINAFAYLGIAVLMFPVLRRRFESLVLGYVGFRVIEFVMQILSDLSPLALLNLSEAFVSAGAQAASSFQAIGTILLAERHWAFQMISITFGSGALLFYSMLYRSKLIPRFISIWGLLGAAVVLANTLFDMFGVSLPNLGFLMLANELFLGVWLIVKGFDSSAIVPLSSNKD
jgi:hypothetical protein